MKNSNKNLYINGDERLTKFNASIVLESDTDITFREMIEFLGILKTYFDTPDNVTTTAIYILKKTWPNYRQWLNRIPYEPIVIAALLVSYDHYKQDPERDPYTFIQICFKKKDFDKRLYEVNKAEIEIKQHIHLRPIQ
jgi:hypothetical protein